MFSQDSTLTQEISCCPAGMTEARRFQAGTSAGAAADQSAAKTTAKRAGRALTITATVFFCIGMLFFFAEKWAMRVWPGLTLDEMIFHLTQPIQGTGGGIIESGIAQALIPSLLVLAASVAAAILLRRKHPKIHRALLTAELLAGIGLCVYSVASFAVETDAASYISSQTSSSGFIEDNYADPNATELTFPEKKRNLIYIYLESMEDTYTDSRNGGGFESDYIPELTELAQESEDFSGSDTALNGGLVYDFCGYTMAGIFAQSTGLPLQTSLSRNNMGTQSSFFPGITALGDILENEGYRQVFLCGSDAHFAGRDVYFQDHGNFEMRDYYWAQETGRIAEDYKVWWGYEDQKLFEYAKETLTELAAGDQPFNLTMLTVDTHFEDGYVCPLCGTEFGDNQYGNVLACSSRQLAAFIEWIRQQDFYDNTTIILSGDHTTMDSDFCDSVSPDYQRKTYVCCINADAEVRDSSKRREYSTLDLFPTTLASLGVTISGDRLGLGTNLFSDTQTLTEQYGADKMNQEMARKSEFLASSNQIVFNDELVSTIRKAVNYSIQRVGNQYINIKIKNLDVHDTADKTVTCSVRTLESRDAEYSAEQTIQSIVGSEEENSAGSVLSGDSTSSGSASSDSTAADSVSSAVSDSTATEDTDDETTSAKIFDNFSTLVEAAEQQNDAQTSVQSYIMERVDMASTTQDNTSLGSYTVTVPIPEDAQGTLIFDFTVENSDGQTYTLTEQSISL